MSKTIQINQVLKSYFEENISVKIIPAKDMMPYFILAGVFNKDVKNGLAVRNVLRRLDKNNQLHLIPYVYAERKVVNTNWFFQRVGSDFINTQVFQTKEKSVQIKVVNTNYRKDSDECYVLDLCDEIMQLKGLRQHRFDFLLGDANAQGREAKLPVDSFYHNLNLVIEYTEKQHSKANIHFDKPDKITVSGVHRGEQRKIYDQRRRAILPYNGIKLIEIDYSNFNFNGKGKIVREYEWDLAVVKKLLAIPT